MRALFALFCLAVAACSTPQAPPVIYPEAELAPGHILAPIRAAMGDQMAFTNARVTGENVMEVEGYRADGAYTFVVSQVDGRWLLTRMERVGPPPPSP